MWRLAPRTKIAQGILPLITTAYALIRNESVNGVPLPVGGTKDDICGAPGGRDDRAVRIGGDH